MILYGTQLSLMGWYAFGSLEGLFSFRRAITLTWCHTFMSLNKGRQTVQKDQSYSIALLPWCCMNYGWILSISGALPSFRCLIADTISLWPKSPESLASALCGQHRLFTLPVVFLVNAFSASSNLPMMFSWASMVSAVMGHGVCLVARPVSLLTICHAQ